VVFGIGRLSVLFSVLGAKSVITKTVGAKFGYRKKMGERRGRRGDNDAETRCGWSTGSRSIGSNVALFSTMVVCVSYVSGVTVIVVSLLLGIGNVTPRRRASSSFTLQVRTGSNL